MTYRYILIPGRHQAVTRFQIDYLQKLLTQNTQWYEDADAVDRRAEVVWAVTSANHGGTQRNPVSGSRRLGMIESVAASEKIPSQVYRISNMTEKPDFAHYLIEEVRLQSRGRTAMNPTDTLVVCSTPAVTEQYRAMGYTVATAELDEATGSLRGPRPWNVVEEIISSGADWRSNTIVRDDLHPVCFDHFERYGLGDHIVEVFQDPLISSDDGDITVSRDYQTYRRAFENGAWRKVGEFASEVEPGRILDVGCATGETLKLLSQQPALFESDFYGVEAARPLYQICEQRKSAGEFGNANMFFYQRNIMRSSFFAHNTLNTIITMALTHEIESYLGRDQLLAFVKRMYDMLAPGGIYINYDVVAPDDKDTLVYALLNETDGENPEDVYPDIPEEKLQEFLSGLSTKARFRRFVKDFRANESDQISYDYEVIDAKEYAVLRRADLCDFLAKKDYIDSWHSEMHERFCFFEHQEWVELLQQTGFEIESTSQAKQNPWLIENRFEPAGKVYTKTADGQLELEPQPVTNTLLFARKPL
ncbi:MAG TPA: methyltransferase domain-containing protein [Candidatus Saccharimonadales bacterium]